MMKQHFSFKEVFTFGWAKTKQHAWFVTLSTVLISIIVSAAEREPLIGLIVPLLAILSVVSISLTISRDHGFSFQDLLTPLLSPKKVLKFLAVTGILVIPALLLVSPLLTGLALQNALVVRIGILLLVPLAYFSTRLKFYPYIVIEHENATVSDMIKMSYALTKNRFLSVFTFLILASLLNLLGAALAGVGLFVTVPVTFFAFAHVYDKLKSHTM